MEIKTIKGISRERWMEFKALAAGRNVPLGVLFEVMLENYEKNGELVWNEILRGEKIISDREADELYGCVKKLRKDKGFRI